MDANTPELLILGAPATAATGVVLRVPLTETFTVVEFGFYVADGADLAAGVLKLQAVDTTAGGATYTDLCVLTSTAAMDQGGIGARRCDVKVDKITNVAFGPGASGNTNAQINPSSGKQFIAVQLNATTAFTAASVIVPFLKVRKQGTGAVAVAGETLVIA